MQGFFAISSWLLAFGFGPLAKLLRRSHILSQTKSASLRGLIARKSYFCAMRIAALDLNNNTPNMGFQSILDIMERSEYDTLDTFDVRAKHEIPDMSYDLYVSSGGPGDPLEGDGIWEVQYGNLLDELWASQFKADPKRVFFICHSFQIACHHFGIGKITQRNEPSTGIFKVQKTEKGRQDPLFDYLLDPFYVADFRSYQVIEADYDRLHAMGAHIIAMEYERKDPELPLALMGVRFSDHMVGVQFHPEAYSEGMQNLFAKPEKTQDIITKYGSHVLEEMHFQLRDPIKLNLTYEKMLPGFVKRSFVMA